MTTVSPTIADLHVHSKASDGVLTPEELVYEAKNCGLQVLALTDHDTLDGLPAALHAGETAKLEVIPGIELSCGWPDREESLHVLGLFVSLEAEILRRKLREQQQKRFTRAFRILARLEQLGIDTTTLRQEFDTDPDRVLGRPHVARFLVANGLVNSTQEAFDRYLSRGRPAYEPKEHLLPEEGIEAIHRAGGMAIIAHPGLLPDWESVWNLVNQYPWDGIEVYYSEHSPAQVQRFADIAHQRNWLTTGGSDYHGDHTKKNNLLGQGGLTAQLFQTFIDGVAARKRMV